MAHGEATITIVGSGFSGVCMAIQLKKAGMHDFVVLEKADDLGGTWRDNTYPGCACDIPSLLYSFSFEPNPAWTNTFPSQQEIWDYLRHCAVEYGVEPHIRYGVEVTGAEYDSGTQTWRVATGTGRTLRTRAVVFAMGALHKPAYPDIAGPGCSSSFAGHTFHSATWDHDYDLTGKRVAVIGTGASAVQFVPRIAPDVERLHLFQRTPPWILPKPERPFTRAETRLFHALPAAQRAYRSGVYWMLEGRQVGFTHPRVMKLAQRKALAHLRDQVPDRPLRKALTPDYVMGCKRVLISNDYYPTLTRRNVEVVTDGIEEITESGVVAGDGVERPVDAIIYSTGFHVTDAFDGLHVLGRDGHELADDWRTGTEAYMGVAVTGYPNMFLLVGPNSGLGHNSMIFMIESQVNYVMQCLRLLSSRRAGRLDVRAGAQAEFNRRLQQRSADTVWTAGGCMSWYLDNAGVNRALWPGFTWEYWLRTRRPKESDYEIV